MAIIDWPTQDPISWTDSTGRRSVHLFEPEDIDAIRAALLAERPLLVQGEPGVGKSQLAQAAAVVLQRAYKSIVVDARTEVRDLRWTEDLVARLADAQMAGLAGQPGLARASERVQDLDNYTYPGPLWWGFQWRDAESQIAGKPVSVPPRLAPTCNPENGAVVLIDEIDKAEADLPNGLLEALGARSFQVRDSNTIRAGENWPLIVITTNEERPLPDAFLRRCVVHRISLPELPKHETKFLEYLVLRGGHHFPDLHVKYDGVISSAARMTMEDRNKALAAGLRPLPGFAEFIDLLRALQSGAKLESPEDALLRLRPYFLQKHSDLRK